ncbi:MAG: hypothetical protein WBL88_06460 [Nitrososphaeraceae archaeon]
MPHRTGRIFYRQFPRGKNLAQKQEILCYINLGHYSGGTVVAISTAGAFPSEVTSETTDLVTIGDLC